MSEICDECGESIKGRVVETGDGMRLHPDCFDNISHDLESTEPDVVTD